MAQIDEFDLAKASLLSSFNLIEDSIAGRVAAITGTDPDVTDLLLGESGFSYKIATYKRVLATFPEASLKVERERDFWTMLDGIRVARNAFAHGTQHIVLGEGRVRHVYADKRSMRRGEFDRSIAVDFLPLAQRLTFKMHLLLSSMVATEGNDTAFFERCMIEAKEQWANLKPQLPKGSSLKWPPKEVPEAG